MLGYRQYGRKGVKDMEWTRGDEYKGLFQIGQRVHSILYGGRDGIISEIHGTQEPGSIRSLGAGMVMGGRANIDVIFPEYVSRMVPEAIIRGVQWRISEEIATREEMGIAIYRANSAIEEKKRKEREAAEAKATEKSELPAKYPYLIPMDETMKYRGHALGAKNLRIELKRAFPGLKFSVKSETYSGGDSINVNWINGPTTEEVKKISDKYQECDFDGMTDSENYRHGAWTEVFGGAHYVSENRDISEESWITLTKSLCELNHAPYTEPYHSVNIPNLQERATTIIHQIMHGTPIPPGAVIKGIERTDCTCGRTEEFYRVVF
jgi:hypothetical protein